MISCHGYSRSIPTSPKTDRTLRKYTRADLRSNAYSPPLPQVFPANWALRSKMDRLGDLWVMYQRSSILNPEFFGLHTMRSERRMYMSFRSCAPKVVPRSSLKTAGNFSLGRLLSACPQVAPACSDQELTLSLGREDLRERGGPGRLAGEWGLRPASRMYGQFSSKTGRRP